MRRYSVTSFLPAVVAAAGLAVVSSAFSPANAYSVVKSDRQGGDPTGYLYDVTVNSSDVGRTLDPVEWLVIAGTKNSSGEETPIDLKASANITVKSLNDNSLSLGIKINNETTSTFQGKPYNAAILSLGMGINPDAGSVTLNNQGTVIFDSAKVQTGQQQFPGGFKQIDACIFAANNCSGGNIKQGLQAGKSDDFELTIQAKNRNGFDDLMLGGSKITLSDFGIKFQTDNGSFEPAGVPEPLTVIGSGLALGFGALFKKEVSKKRNKAVVKS